MSIYAKIYLPYSNCPTFNLDYHSISFSSERFVKKLKLKITILKCSGASSKRYYYSQQVREYSCFLTNDSFFNSFLPLQIIWRNAYNTTLNNLLFKLCVAKMSPNICIDDKQKHLNIVIELNWTNVRRLNI